MLKKVIYLTYDGLTDPLGFSQILPYQIGIVQAIPEIELCIISFEKPERYKQWKNKVDELILGKRIEWLPLRYTRKPILVSQGWNLAHLYYLVRKKLKQESISLVHTRSYMTSLIVPRLKRRYSIRWLFDMRGLWADERVDGRIWNLSNPIHRFLYNYFKRKEKEFLMQADWVVTLTQRSVPILSQIAGQNIQEKLSVIPTATDFQIFQFSEEKRSDIRRQLLNNPDSDFLLVFSGSLGTWYLLEKMLRFFKALLQRNPASYFLFITHSESGMIYQNVRKMDISENHVIVHSVHYSEVPHFLSGADGGICFIRPAFSKIASFPTKIGEYLAMGLPVIANDIGDTRWILEETRGGICIEDLTTESLSIAAEKFFTFAQEHKSISKKREIRERARQYMDKEIAIQKYVSIYQRFLSKK